MRSITFSQFRDLRMAGMAVVWENLVTLKTVRSKPFWICWRRFIWDLGRLL